MAADSDRDSTVLNVRISKEKLNTFKHLSASLGVSVNSVVNSFLSWAEAPVTAQSNWIDDVRSLREMVRDMKVGESMVLEELTRDRLEERTALCHRLRNIGYIDDFATLQSRRDPEQMICSYKLTTSGLIIARALDYPPDSSEVVETHSPADVPECLNSPKETSETTAA